MKKIYIKLLLTLSILAVIFVVGICIVINVKDTYTYAYVEDIISPNFNGTYTIPATKQSGNYKFSDRITANVGDKIIINGDFQILPEQNQFLFLFFSYAKLRVTVAGDEVYSFNNDSEIADYLLTAGDVWHEIPIPVGTNSKDITFEFELVKKDFPLIINYAYVASTMGLLNMHRQKNLIPLLLSLLIILIGVITVVFSLVFIVTKYKAEPAVYMGIAGIASGIWSACENDMITFFGISPANAYFWSLLSLYVIPIAFTIYCILSYKLKFKWLLKLIAVVNIFVVTVLLLLQLFGIAKMVDFLKIAQVSSIVLAMLIVCVLGYEYVKTSQKAIAGFALRFFVLLIFASVEILNFYVDFNMVFSDSYLIGFVVFYLWQFVDIINGLSKLVAQSVKLSVYQSLAITDQLTGIKNRTAYCELEKIYNDKLYNYSSIGVGMFDLNNLKGINDAFGHSVGDEYILNCTRIICDSFPGCSVFRVGGDEFIALFVEMSASQIEACHQELLKEICKSNETQEVPIGIAFGYSFYNPKTDSVLNEALKRADTNMYINKQAIKEELNISFINQ